MSQDKILISTLRKRDKITFEVSGEGSVIVSESRGRSKASVDTDPGATFRLWAWDDTANANRMDLGQVQFEGNPTSRQSIDWNRITAEVALTSRCVLEIRREGQDLGHVVLTTVIERRDTSDVSAGPDADTVSDQPSPSTPGPGEPDPVGVPDSESDLDPGGEADPQSKPDSPQPPPEPHTRGAAAPSDGDLLDMFAQMHADLRQMHTDLTDQISGLDKKLHKRRSPAPASHPARRKSTSIGRSAGSHRQEQDRSKAALEQATGAARKLAVALLGRQDGERSSGEVAPELLANLIKSLRALQDSRAMPNGVNRVVTLADRLDRISERTPEAVGRCLDEERIGDALELLLAEVDGDGSAADGRARGHLVSSLVEMVTALWRDDLSRADFEALRSPIDDCLAVLDIELVVPEPGRTFSHRTQRMVSRVASASGGGARNAIVKVIQPGFRSDGKMLEKAEVAVAD